MSGKSLVFVVDDDASIRWVLEKALSNAGFKTAVFEGADDDEVVLGAYRREGRWSEDLVELLVELVGDRGTLIDAGAHVGLVCVPVVERGGGSALAFEPAPDSHAFLRSNVARHGLGDRIETFEVALFSESGRRALAMSPDNAGDHRVVGTGAGSTDRRVIEVRWLGQTPG